MEQTTIFDLIYDRYKITKPIKLIELFAGYGSQNLALKYLGANYSHHKIVEWAVRSIEAYNNIHIQDYTDYSKDLSADEVANFLFDKGISQDYNSPMTLKQITQKGEAWQRKVYNDIIATNNLVDISRVHAADLEIKGDYEYIMTYSFPCQDLSLAGLGKGMSRDSGTRSGLLWQVERILFECKDLGTLPNVLIMENVPEVKGSNNIQDFTAWVKQLEKLGYSNYCDILNAKHYGIPQNRKRCFMVSILGEWNYKMPKEMRLEYKLKDLLENNVAEKYYLSKQMIDFYTYNSQKQKENGNGFEFKPQENADAEIGKTITTRSGSRMDDNFIIDNTVRLGGLFDNDKGTHQAGSIYSQNGTSPALDTAQGGHRTPLIVENKRLKETIENNEVKDGAFIDAYNKQVNANISGTITTRTNGDNMHFIAIKNATKEGYLEANIGDGIDINSRMETHRGTVQKGLSQTLTCAGGNDVGVVVDEPNLKQELCDTLIEKGLVKENDVIRHSYTHNRLDNGIENMGRVQSKDNNIMPTLDTRSDCFGIVVKANEDNYVGTYQYAKSDNFMKGRDRLQEGKEVADTLQTNGKEGVVVKVGNYSPSGHNAASIVDQEGIAPTVMENHGTITAIQCKDTYAPLEKDLFTDDGNIKRYLNSEIVDEFKDGQMATTTYPNGYGHGTRVHNESIALNTTEVPSVKNNLRIRKLTPKECMRLMGVKDSDSCNIKQSDASIYHLAGDSIVSTCLMGIFGELLDIDYKSKIRELTRNLKNIQE